MLRRRGPRWHGATGTRHRSVRAGWRGGTGSRGPRESLSDREPLCGAPAGVRGQAERWGRLGCLGPHGTTLAVKPEPAAGRYGADGQHHTAVRLFPCRWTCDQRWRSYELPDSQEEEKNNAAATSTPPSLALRAAVHRIVFFVNTRRCQSSDTNRFRGEVFPPATSFFFAKGRGAIQTTLRREHFVQTEHHLGISHEKRSSGPPPRPKRGET